MFNYKKAIQRYRVAQNFGLPVNLCIKVFFLGNGIPKENFEKGLKSNEKNNS